MKKLKTYHWIGIDRKGTRVKGSSSAYNIEELKSALQGQTISLLKYQQRFELPFFHPQKIKACHIMDFSRQLATLTNASVPLAPALQIMSQSHENPLMRSLINSIKKAIESGNSFSEALSKHPEYFDKLYCNLIYAGEQSSSLDAMLNQIANYQEKNFKLKSKIKRALIYPATVLLVALGVMATLLVLVVPQFETLFQGFGAGLPIYTQYILRISRFFQEYGGMILISLITLGFLFHWQCKRSATLAYKIDQRLLKLPIIGKIITKAIIARFARTLATTISAGLPLSESMQIIAGSSGNLVYTDAVLKIRDQVVMGQTIHAAMEKVLLFPQRVVQMLTIAEESGAMAEMLQKIAEFYEQDVDSAADNLSKLLEPVIMVVLGVLVGGLITAMYLPIFRLGSVI